MHYLLSGLFPKLLLGILVSSCLIALYRFSDCYVLSEAEQHRQGRWRSPKLSIDAFVVRKLTGAQGTGSAPGTDKWQVLLIQRNRAPFKDCWAMPGGFVSWKEDPIDAVRREVNEETHLVVDPQVPPVFVTFRGSPTRDPRTHTVSAGYACKVTAASLALLQRDDDVGAVGWFDFNEAANGLPMAFDHGDMLKEFLGWFELEGKIKHGMFVEAQLLSGQ